jgi:hypothetical protein
VCVCVCFDRLIYFLPYLICLTVDSEAVPYYNIVARSSAMP